MISKSLELFLSCFYFFFFILRDEHPILAMKNVFIIGLLSLLSWLYRTFSSEISGRAYAVRCKAFNVRKE